MNDHLTAEQRAARRRALAVERTRRWKSDNPEHARQHSLDHNRRFRERRYERYRELDRATRARYPERVRARWIVSNALKTGRLVRPHRCDECGERCQPHAHHTDYSQPLVIQWLCRDCHAACHPKHVHRPVGASASSGSFTSAPAAALR